MKTRSVTSTKKLAIKASQEEEAYSYAESVRVGREIIAKKAKKANVSLYIGRKAVAALERYMSFKLVVAADLAIVAALLLWWLA